MTSVLLSMRDRVQGDYLVVTFCVLLLCFSQVLLQLLDSPVSDSNLNAVNSREYIIHKL